MSIFVILRSFNLYLGASFANLMNRKTSTTTTLIAICCTNLLRNKTQNKNLKNSPTLADGVRGWVNLLNHSPKIFLAI